MKFLSYHKSNLPHYYQPNTTYFITFRVKDSIPLDSLLDIKNKYDKLRTSYNSNHDEINNNYFFEYDNLLHQNELNKYLINSELTEIVKNIIHKYDSKYYKLICYSVMPNHVHLIFYLLDNSPNVGKIMQNIKRISAFRINKVLNKSGNFWQSESYDHIVRDEDELYKLIEYNLNNPVKASLVDDWREFSYNYLARDY